MVASLYLIQEQLSLRLQVKFEEPLIKAGRIKLPYEIGAGKMIKFKAPHVYKMWARNSRAIAKPAFIILGNTGIDYFGLKLIVHVLIRGSLGQ
jgi:hypothetical protein